MAEPTPQVPASAWLGSFRRFCQFITPGVHGTSSASQQRRMLQEEIDEEEDLRYGATTRCLSSYYSIFVARLAIMVMLAILIGMLTILTWHFTKVYTKNSLNSLAYDFRYELLQRPILRMWNILNSTVEITVAQVKLSEYVINHYERPGSQSRKAEMHEAMKDITWALFASRKALNAITISYRSGFVQAFHRDHRSNSTFYIYSDLVNSSASNSSKGSNSTAIWYREPLHPATGEKTGNPRQIPPDDLINIAGLSEVRDGAASWHVAVSKFTDSPFLSAALPVQHSSDGSIVAVVGVTTSLYSVGQLMRELVEFHSGYMYLTSLEGHVLATSTDSPLLTNSTSGPTLMLASESEDPVIKQGAQWLQQAYGDKFPINNEVHVENIRLGRQKYYIDSFFLNLKRLPLVGVIIIPRKYIMGKVDQIGFTTLVIMISASVCILAIGCVCIMILTSGVSKEMKLRAELISQLDARRRAEASSNYKSQFLANMSHELRTPMAAVIGLLDILIGDHCLTNEQYATVTQIRKCSTALLRLLNNILDLSKVESGKLVLEEAEFDLGRELEGLVDMFSVQCNNQNVETILDLSDDMPKVVRGDSARVVQIFTNLISNSIKFTSMGHIILRGWCEVNTSSNQILDQKIPQCVPKAKEKQHGSIVKRDSKDRKITLRFEVDDTGCGIDPSKWESVFESFEQADPSTTRKHGGTGLGLCIVRNLVNKMGGDIKVVKKDGPGTLMQLHLVLGMPTDTNKNHLEIDFGEHNLTVLLALSGSKVRSIMSQWLRKNRIPTWEASEWNGLTQILQEIYPSSKTATRSCSECSASESLKLNTICILPGDSNIKKMRASNIVIIMDTTLLDLSTNIWEQQLIFLDQYHGKAKFAWILSHDITNAIKVELRRKGHYLMVNKSLYKSKILQILEAVVRERNLQHQCKSTGNSRMAEDLYECHEIDPIQFETASSDDSDRSDIDSGSLRKCTVNIEERTIHQASYHPHHRTVGARKKSECPAFLDNFHHHNSNSLSNNNTEALETLSDPLKCGNACEKIEVEMNHKEDRIDSGHETAAWVELSRKCVGTPPMYGNACESIETNGSHGRKNDDREHETLELIETPQRSVPGMESGPSISYGSASRDFNQPNLEGKIPSPKKQPYDEKNYWTSKLTNNNTISTSGSFQAEHNYKQTELVCRTTKPSGDGMLRDVSEGPSCAVPCQPLGGLYILLAEDTPILQRVATQMLEKMGATVTVVGDGLQAVDALRSMLYELEHKKRNYNLQDSKSALQAQLLDHPLFDLILMDCQMPKLDGYEATRAIRRIEAEKGSHIPIVAQTAHAMPSDEAKCLGVGMDAYLTKPIDCKLMVDTILSLTRRNATHEQGQCR